MSWEIFEQKAMEYEAWYASAEGSRAHQAESDLLHRLLSHFPEAKNAVEVGCGTGHFTGWLAQRGLTVVGLDRSPAMLAQMRRLVPGVPAVLGDAHRLPFRDGAVDLAVFVTTLEFLEDPEEALSEATRIARQGLLLLVLNRWSLGGFSRRWGPQASRSIVGKAEDFSPWSLMVIVRRATGERRRAVRWTSTLFPDGYWHTLAKIPFGEVIGMAVLLEALPSPPV
jgi:SAM-dependent methyltransferase